jgi:hypothetical protein
VFCFDLRTKSDHFLCTVKLLVFRRVRKIAKTDFLLRRVCPSVHMEQLGFYYTDFDKFLYLSFFLFRKRIEKIQVLLTADKSNGHPTCRPVYIYSIISLSSS